MAQFHVGQRVRIVKPHDASDPHGLDGKETIVTSPRIAWFSFGCYRTKLTDEIGESGVWEGALTPLTDPGADQFIERIKKLSREPINEVPKVTVEK